MVIDLFWNLWKLLSSSRKTLHSSSFFLGASALIDFNFSVDKARGTGGIRSVEAFVRVIEGNLSVEYDFGIGGDFVEGWVGVRVSGEGMSRLPGAFLERTLESLLDFLVSVAGLR